MPDPRSAAASPPPEPRLTRRAAIAGAGAAAAASLAGCGGADAYDRAVAETWRHGGPAGQRDAALRALARYATLAPSSHNTQCWRFALERDGIRILPDFTRRCPAVDPDDHHLYASLGCAAENIVQAAPALGLRAVAVPGDVAADGLRLVVEPGAARPGPLFAAIPLRQCTRADYDGRPLAAGELARLEAAARGPDAEVLLFTARADLERILEFVVAANTRQVQDPAFVAELRQWIRFSEGEALATRDGLYSGCTGNPSLPRWLAEPLFGFLFTADGEAERYAGQLRSSAGVAVFVADRPGPAGWAAAGRACQRFQLQATALGLATAFVNQPVEVDAVRGDFAAAVGAAGRRPDLVLRFGRGPAMPRSLRRPLAEVLVV